MKSVQELNKVRVGTRLIGQGLALSAMLSGAFMANAAINLADGNSTMSIDPMSSTGANSWTVEGQNQLFQQWFWYRVGPAGPEAPINAIGGPVVSGVTANSATISYSSGLFDLSVTYTLSGGSIASGLSDLSEDIAIHNTSGAALDLHFFQFSDFNLEGTAGGDNVLLYPNISPFALAYQWELNTGLSESIVNNNPYADRGEVGFTPSVLNKLNDGNTDDLNNLAGPIGPGDVSFAFQWDFSINPGDTKTISKLKNLNINVIPEPTSAALGLLGLGLLAARRMGRRS